MISENSPHRRESSVSWMLHLLHSFVLAPMGSGLSENLSDPKCEKSRHFAWTFSGRAFLFIFLLEPPQWPQGTYAKVWKVNELYTFSFHNSFWHLRGMVYENTNSAHWSAIRPQNERIDVSRSPERLVHLVHQITRHSFFFKTCWSNLVQMKNWRRLRHILLFKTHSAFVLSTYIWLWDFSRVAGKAMHDIEILKHDNNLRGNIGPFETFC